MNTESSIHCRCHQDYPDAEAFEKHKKSYQGFTSRCEIVHPIVVK